MVNGLSPKERCGFIKSVENDNGWVDCPYCEEPFHVIYGSVDHIKPRSRGGQNWYRNLVLVCAKCNKEKRDMPLSVFCYLRAIAPEGVYLRLKRLKKSIPKDMLDLLGYDD